MDKLAALNAYVTALRANATQLNTRAIAGDWFRAGVDVETAANWANWGYLPRDALPMIAQGMTPELASAGDDALVAEHGILGAGPLKLQLSDPDATIVVDPDCAEPDQK